MPALRVTMRETYKRLFRDPPEAPEQTRAQEEVAVESSEDCWAASCQQVKLRPAVVQALWWGPQSQQCSTQTGKSGSIFVFQQDCIIRFLQLGLLTPPPQKKQQIWIHSNGLKLNLLILKLERAFFLNFFCFFMCGIQHYFICRASDSTVSEEARIEPRTVATLARLTDRCSNHSTRFHPQLARSHPHSTRSHSHLARSHPHSAGSYSHLLILQGISQTLHIDGMTRSIWLRRQESWRQSSKCSTRCLAVFQLQALRVSGRSALLVVLLLRSGASSATRR